MNGLDLFLDAFHLIRPWWLLALLPVAATWWFLKARAGTNKLQMATLAPHLQDALTVGKQERRRLEPVDVAALCLALLVLAAAGPSWTRMPNPFVSQSAPLVVVVKVTPSMLADDVAPTRLERARQKVRDLLKLRVGARTALVAYAGSAHRVVPLTEDARLIEPYLAGLSPEIMPRGGDDVVAAHTLALQILANEPTPGSALFLLDSISTEAASTLDAANDASMAVLALLPGDQDDPGLSALRTTPVIRVTPDNQDVNQLERTIQASYQQALSRDSDQPWEDRGWLLAWPAALFMLLGFRKGFTLGRPARSITPAILTCIGLSLMPADHARADIEDWFFTPDQQGHRLMERKDFEAAAEKFTDPMWKNHALYRQGKYEEAAKGYEQLETAAASFAQGMALIKSRKYRDAVRAFELTLKRDPDYPGAAANLETAQDIVEWVEDAREQSDTGEEMGIGADEVVFDNESGRGADTQIEAETDKPALLSADQWMNTVDTRTDDFLRQRFAIEANRED